MKTRKYRMCKRSEEGKKMRKKRKRTMKTETKTVSRKEKI